MTRFALGAILQEEAITIKGMGETMRKTVAVTIIILILGAIAYFTWLKEPAQPTELTTVTIHQAAKTLLYLPLYVAIEQGYLRDAGISARIVTAGGDSQAFAALASGDAQFAQGDPTFAAISHERGGPGLVIASVLDRVAFWGVTFNEDLRPFSDPQSFRGLTVVTYPQPNTAYVVQASLVERADLKLGVDTSIVQAAFGTELGPLQAGTAQMAMSIEPTVSQSLAEGAQVVFSYPDAWGPFLLTGLMTTEEFMQENPSVVEGTVWAYDRSLDLIRTQPELAAQIGEQYFPEVSPTVIRAAVRRLVEEKVFPEHAKVNLASWRAALELRQRIGDLRSADHDNLILP